MIFPKLLVGLSVLYILFVVVTNGSTLFKPFNANESTSKFIHSQWRVPNSKSPISDEDLYAYAGYKYIHGENPVLVNPEVPPVGKYLIGLSILFFNNQHLASFLAAIGALILIYFLTKQISQSQFAASAALFLTATHSLFIDQILHSPQLEIFQLFFVLLFTFFIVKYYQHKKTGWLLGAGVAFGLFISIKIFLLFFAFMNGWLVLYFLLNKKDLKRTVFDLTVLNLLALTTFVLSYFRYFSLGHSFREFLGTQKWIYGFYSQSHIDMSKLVGNYLFLTLFNRWRFWSEGYPIVHYESWNIFWPVIFLVGIYCMGSLIMNKTKNHSSILLLTSFFIIYNAFLIAVPIYPRYLLLLFTPLNILIAIRFAKILKQ